MPRPFRLVPAAPSCARPLELAHSSRSPAAVVAAVSIAACLGFAEPSSAQLVRVIEAMAAGQWSPEGPSPITFGQVEGIANGPVSGALNTVAAHPTDADILYVGSVNGGIWKTTNATAGSVVWTHQTADQESLSIGTVDFDPTDGTNQTLVAGIGRYSSFFVGAERTGLLRTTNGGMTWTPIGGDMVGRNVVGVAPRGSTLVVAVDDSDSFSCPDLGVFRSIDGGASWGRATGIPNGISDALASDPGSSSILYASVVFADVCSAGANGIYRSSNTGANWVKVSNAAMDALLADSVTVNVDIAIGPGATRGGEGTVFVSIMGTNGKLGGIFQSTDDGANWTTLDIPGTQEKVCNELLPGCPPPAATDFVGVHPGSQGSIHSSLAADPSDPDVVYVGGDRQPAGFLDGAGFPNSVGAVNFSGRLFRGDAGLGSGSQFSPLTHSGTASNSSPHADSRDMAFDANGNLIEVDDGGIFRRAAPTSSAGDWFSLNGNLQVTELHSLVHDANANVLMGGAQDNGASEQSAAGSVVWRFHDSGDGGDTAVSPPTARGTTSTRYSSSQNLGGFRRREVNSANTVLMTAFPLLTVTGGGDPLDPHFVTPIRVNVADADRLIIGAENSVYESTDRGDTISEIGAGIVVPAGGRDAISTGASGDIDILYVGGCIGSCSNAGDGVDGVFVRTTNGGSLVHRLASSTIVGVAGDPGDANVAFAIETTAVQRTGNKGVNWTNVTGNLLGLSPGTLRSGAFADNGTDEAILVGSSKGVFYALGPAFDDYAALDQGLPNVPITELRYDPASDDLFVGTLGLGAYRIEDFFATLNGLFADGFESGNTSAWSATIP